jgi:hypothetical protein
VDHLAAWPKFFEQIVHIGEGGEQFMKDTLLLPSACCVKTKNKQLARARSVPMQ